MFLSIEGRAEIITDEATLAAHWTKELERWWPEGPETPGVALLNKPYRKKDLAEKIRQVLDAPAATAA